MSFILLILAFSTSIGLGAENPSRPRPRVCSHSLGYFLHEPGPLIGLPWEQVKNDGRGDVKLVPNSYFTAEMSVTAPVPAWGGLEFRLPLEQDVAFTTGGTYFLAGRQERFHLVR